MKHENIISRLAAVRGMRWVIVLAALGVLLLSLPSVPREEKKDAGDGNTETTLRFYTESLEERIGNLCAEVSGVSDVHVLLTLEGGCEYIYAENVSSTSREFLLAEKNGEESPVLLMEIYPRVRGVAVVCRGGDSSSVRLTLTELLSAALGIPASAIRVAGS